MKMPPECEVDGQGRQRHYFVWGELPREVARDVLAGRVDPAAATPGQPSEPPPQTKCVCGSTTWTAEKLRWLGVP